MKSKKVTLKFIIKNKTLTQYIRGPWCAIAALNYCKSRNGLP